MSDKKLFTKKNAAPVIVLTVICLIVAALLGATNMLTAPIIAEVEREKIASSLVEAFPGGSFGDAKELPEDAPETVRAIYPEANGKGHVVTLITTKGFTGQEIGLSVGVDTEGKVVGVVITAYNDSLGKSAMNGAVENFKGVGNDGIDDVDLVAGVTYSSNAVRGAVKDALAALGFGGSDGYTEEDILRMAGELIGSDQLTEVANSGSFDSVKKIYKDGGGRGFVVYTQMPGEFVPVASEGLVAIDPEGKIIAVDLITWVVGHGVEPGDFETRFTGKTLDDVSEVELISGATYTSSDFRSSVADALAAVSGKDASPTVPIYSIVTACLVGAAVLALIAFKVTMIIKRRNKA